MLTPEIRTTIKITKYLNRFLTKKFKGFDSGDIKFKKHREVVTSVDLESNKYITETLLKHFPNYDIISEEAKKVDNIGNKAWYVDPLDGTTNFAYGSTDFSTCIGLEDSGEILLGVIGVPSRNKIYLCEKGSGAYCDKKKLRVSSRDKLQDALIYISPGYSTKGRIIFKKLLTQESGNLPGHWRHLGSAGIEFCKIANGKADAIIMTNLKLWDVVAGILLVREAGGRVTNFAGDEWKIGDETLVASNGIIHDDILKLTRGLK